MRLASGTGNPGRSRTQISLLWNLVVLHCIRGGSAQNRYLFQASDIGKGGISLVEVYERVTKSVISLAKKSQGLTDAFYGSEKKLIKHSGFEI